MITQQPIQATGICKFTIQQHDQYASDQCPNVLMPMNTGVWGSNPGWGSSATFAVASGNAFSMLTYMLYIHLKMFHF